MAADAKGNPAKVLVGEFKEILMGQIAHRVQDLGEMAHLGYDRWSGIPDLSQ